jgi:hypothetical protein
MSIDAAGRVAQRLTTTSGLVDQSAGISVFRDGYTMIATKDSDFSQELWSRPFSRPSWITAYPTTLKGRDGTFWVLTDIGYVDAQTGQPVGFGKNAFEDGERYTLISKDVVFREDSHNRGKSGSRGFWVPSVMRIDPATGEDLWDKPFEGRLADAVSTAGTTVVAFTATKVGRLNLETGALEAASGLGKGAADHAPTWAEVTPDGHVVLGGSPSEDAADDVAVLDADTYRPGFSIPPGPEGPVKPVGYGHKVLYVGTGTTVDAYRLDGDGSALWSVPTGGRPVTLRVVGGHVGVFAASPGSGTAGHRSETMRLVAD